MNDASMIIVALVVGMGLGAMFFGGLWWTLRKAMASPWPALWFAPSLLLRMSLTLLGLYLVSAGHWQRMLACLAGMAVSRAAVTWMTRLRSGPPREVSRAAHS